MSPRRKRPPPSAPQSLQQRGELLSARCDRRPLPMSVAEMHARGWEAIDVLFVTGDAYVDHPSFAMAVLGRVLEAAGFRVGIVAQPDWRSCEDWRRFGRPRLMTAVSAGAMDSMINHYTASRKVRNADAYSPGGRIGMRPDRATLAYCQRAREAHPGVPVIAGGVEVSLRRLAHYDYWSDTVRRSILLDSKADLLVFGMGEEVLVEIARRLAAGEPVAALRDLRGIVFATGASATPPGDGVVLPSYEEVRADRRAFAEATRMIHLETNPHNARRLIQWHGRQAVVCNPPRFPLCEKALDAIYALPYSRRPHPSYREPIPAFEIIKDSVTAMRGCFGGCTFCSITIHQGRAVQSRSPQSVLDEIRRIARDPAFKGAISDVGGPTANMYQMKCGSPEAQAVCRRQSCLYPAICRRLDTSHAPLLELLRKARHIPGVKKVLVASGIRMDLARRCPEFVRQLARHHVGGLLKVAPEHTDPRVLRLMRKPPPEDFAWFADRFRAESRQAGQRQYLVPYFMAGHPGSDLRAMIDLATFLKRNGYRPDQVQDFIPAPMDVATAMYYTGIDPFSKKPVHVARTLRERKLQRALLQFFRPENYWEVRRALLQAGRGDLIGERGECLIPSHPPRDALRRRVAADAARSPRDALPGPRRRRKKQSKKESRRRPGPGYRPDASTATKSNRRPFRSSG